MTTATAPTGAAVGRERGADLDTVTEDGGWVMLFWVGGLAAWGVVAFVPVQLLVLFWWPLPTNVLGWFARFQENAIAGLLDMDLLMLADYVFFALLFVALYVALRRAHRSLAAIALTLELLAVAIYVSSASAFEMFSASRLYAAAGSEAERTVALAAGQAVVFQWQGTAFSASYVLAGLAQLLVGVAMLRRGASFSRLTAYAGIVAGALALVPPTIGVVGLVFSLLSLLPMWLFLILAGRRLLGLASEPGWSKP